MKRALSLALSMLIALSLTPLGAIAFALEENSGLSEVGSTSFDTAEEASAEVPGDTSDDTTAKATEETTEGTLETNPVDSRETSPEYPGENSLDNALDDPLNDSPEQSIDGFEAETPQQEGGALVASHEEDAEEPDGSLSELGADEADPSLSTYAELAWTGSAPPVVEDGDSVTLGGMPSGTLTVPAGATIAIGGTVSGTTAGISLNIGSGATILWSAFLQGTRARTADALITVGGGGMLALESCTIANSGTGSSLIINGANTSVVVGGGAIIDSGGASGNSVLIAASQAVLTVEAGGLIESQDTNSHATVLIQNGILGTTVNVNGGTILSIGSGYAISDGSSFDTGTSNTSHIAIQSGSIISGSACAIRSSGTGSSVVVSGGLVTNAAANNVNPTINMNGGTGTNVIVEGGTVQATLETGNGFAIQTTGNVLVSDGLVSAVNGRAINLIGALSTATVNGGTVQVTGTSASSAAISTATDNPATVINASIRVSGSGKVVAVNGNAINATGANNYVTVEGGSVLTTGGGNAINAGGASATISVIDGIVQTTGSGNGISASGANAQVLAGGGMVQSLGSGHAISATGTNAYVGIDGGKVRASGSGNAINTTGASATVIVNNTADIPSGSQVSATTGWAINATSTVRVLGGFVFAYGQTDSEVIRSSYSLNSPSGNGVVVAWKTPSVYTYVKETAEGLAVYPTSVASATWIFGGIDYSLGTGAGFFEIDVTVFADNGLIFNVNDGKFYVNMDGSGNPYSAANSGFEYTPPPGTTTWDSSSNTLTLDNFSWNANMLDGTDSVQVSLILYGDTSSLTIDLASGSTNSFVSSSKGQTVAQNGLAGIYAFHNVGTLTITGSGTLQAVGGTMSAAGSMSHGIIFECNVIIAGGTVIASGGTTTYTSTGLFRGVSGCDLTIDGGSLVASGAAVSSTGTSAISAGIWLYGTTGNCTIKSGTVATSGGLTTAAQLAISTGIIGSFGVTGGTVTAIGNDATGGNVANINRAFYAAPNSLPVSYVWWTDGMSADPGGPGTLCALGAPYPYNDYYDHSIIPDNQFVKMVAGPFAIVNDKELRGVVGDTLAKGETAELWIFGVHLDPASLIDTIASDWFAFLPAGLSVEVTELVSFGSSVYSWALTLEFSETPLEKSTDVFDITIPESAVGVLSMLPLGAVSSLADGAGLPVIPNPNARFNIAAVFDFFVGATAGGMVSGASTGRYLAGTSILANAVALPGYHFTGWTVLGATILGALGAHSAAFGMPENRVVLIANFEKDIPPVEPPDDDTGGSSSGGGSGAGGGGSSGGGSSGGSGSSGDGSSSGSGSSGGGSSGGNGSSGDGGGGSGNGSGQGTSNSPGASTNTSGSNNNAQDANTGTPRTGDAALVSWLAILSLIALGAFCLIRARVRD
ncbi:MAG: hypothetical protein FWD27_02610 [Coriobacteriia bacterium]|nr:hypothetical protein [Coriobacteriia bacterium]